MLLLITLLCAVLIFVLILWLSGYAATAGGSVNTRMQWYTKSNANASEVDLGHKSQDTQYSRKAMELIRYLGVRAKKLPQAKIFELKMQQAGLPLLGSEFIVVLVGFTFLTTIVTWFFSGSFIEALVVGISAGLLCMMYVNIKISRRRQAFDNQLGDALVMMGNAMRSGFSFMQAVDMVANEMTAPLASEFAKLVGEMRLGIPTDDALTNLGQRIGSKDFDLVIIAVIIHRQVGGNLAQIFDSISTTINERIKMKREIKTLTSQGRLSGWILGALPFAMGIILTLISPGYLTPLFTDPLGHLMIMLGLISQTMGIFFIKRIVDIDV